jgi:hypothetical protein
MTPGQGIALPLYNKMGHSSKFSMSYHRVAKSAIFIKSLVWLGVSTHGLPVWRQTLYQTNGEQSKTSRTEPHLDITSLDEIISGEVLPFWYNSPWIISVCKHYRNYILSLTRNFRFNFCCFQKMQKFKYYYLLIETFYTKNISNNNNSISDKITMITLPNISTALVNPDTVYHHINDRFQVIAYAN